MTALDVLAGRAQWAVEQGDVLERLAALPDGSVNCVVTSPPYWGLRDYGTATWDGGDPACDHRKVADPIKAVATSTLGGGKKTTGHQQEGHRFACRCGAVRIDNQIGLEPTPDAYVARMVEVFREVRRVLRPDGTCWVNLGDSYNSNPSWGRGKSTLEGRPQDQIPSKPAAGWLNHARTDTLKSKDLIGIPWRVAFALQADGWWLRSDIVWAKPNPMPESVTDRPTRSHEYLFLLTKSARYAYDADAIREEGEGYGRSANFRDARYLNNRSFDNSAHDAGDHGGGRNSFDGSGRNKRTVWTIATEPYPDAHFATMPTALVEPCILAGCPARTCPACGAPWARVVERTSTVKGARGARPSDARTHNNAPHRSEITVETTTLGWQPTCDCGDCLESKDGRHRWQDGADFCERCGRDYENRFLEPVPGVVLDPFAGSGTVVLEALRHGRRGIGIELNPKYVEMASRRIFLDCPLFNGGEAAG